MDILLRCLGTSKDCKEKITGIEDDDGDFFFFFFFYDKDVVSYTTDLTFQTL